MEKLINIIGAGITGLTSAYFLLRCGWNVRLIESSEHLGGLASSVMMKDVPVEKYYHFICKDDDDLVHFINEMGLSSRLSWKEASTSCFFNGSIYPFNTPFDLLSFTPIPLFQRIRFGTHALICNWKKNWHSLDKLPARPWLIDHV